MPHFTDTQLKLRDAGIQMKLALRNVRDDDFFRSCINAFIAAARSVTFVMECESSNVPELLEWYKSQTATFATDPLFRFFNEQRVHTVHRGNVRPEKAGFSFSVIQSSERHDPSRGVITGFDFGGIGPPPIRPGDVFNTTSEGEAIYWTFTEAEQYLPGQSPNVFRLCEEYFVRLKGMVHAWLEIRASLGVH